MFIQKVSRKAKLETLLEIEIRIGNWKSLAENQTAKMEVGKMFALKSFSENNQKIESEVWNPKWKLAKFVFSS